MSKTQLKTRSIHGKEYVEVNERLKYFRSNHPGGRIKTSIVSMQNDEIVMSAAILNADGDVLSVGHAHEEKSSSRINSTSYVENCETSAIGRALGIFGIGIDGGVASAEEVDMAIARQESKAAPKKSAPKQASNVVPMEQGQVNDGETLEWFAQELLNPDAEVINAYLRNIGWLDNGMAFSDLPTDKLQYAVDNHEALLAQAKEFALKSDPEVAKSVAKSVGKGGAS